MLTGWFPHEHLRAAALHAVNPDHFTCERNDNTFSLRQPDNKGVGGGGGNVAGEQGPGTDEEDKALGGGGVAEKQCLSTQACSAWFSDYVGKFGGQVCGEGKITRMLSCVCVRARTHTQTYTNTHKHTQTYTHTLYTCYSIFDT